MKRTDKDKLISAMREYLQMAVPILRGNPNGVPAFEMELLAESIEACLEGAPCMICGEPDPFHTDACQCDRSEAPSCMDSHCECEDCDPNWDKALSVLDSFPITQDEYAACTLAMASAETSDTLYPALKDLIGAIPAIAITRALYPMEA